MEEQRKKQLDNQLRRMIMLETESKKEGRPKGSLPPKVQVIRRRKRSIKRNIA